MNEAVAYGTGPRATRSGATTDTQFSAAATACSPCAPDSGCGRRRYRSAHQSAALSPSPPLASGHRRFLWPAPGSGRRWAAEWAPPACQLPRCGRRARGWRPRSRGVRDERLRARLFGSSAVQRMCTECEEEENNPVQAKSDPRRRRHQRMRRGRRPRSSMWWATAAGSRWTRRCAPTWRGGSGLTSPTSDPHRRSSGSVGGGRPARAYTVGNEIVFDTYSSLPAAPTAGTRLPMS